MTLKEILSEKKISLYQFSKETGIPYSTLSDIVNGKTNIDTCTISTMKKIADGLSVQSLQYGKCTTAAWDSNQPVFRAEQTGYAGTFCGKGVSVSGGPQHKRPLLSDYGVRDEKGRREVQSDESAFFSTGGALLL